MFRIRMLIHKHTYVRIRHYYPFQYFLSYVLKGEAVVVCGDLYYRCMYACRIFSRLDLINFMI